MDNLIESILTNDLVSAKEIFEDRMNTIRERKLYEEKRMIQAEAAGGGLTKAEVEARKKAGYKKASDVLGDPRKEMTPIAGHQFKKVKRKVSEETLDEIKLPGEIAGSLGRKIAAGGVKLARKYLGTDFSKRYMAGRKASAKEPSDDEFAKQAARSAGAEPSNAPETPKKDGIKSKLQRGAKGAYNVWMQREKPKSVGGHALSLISKTLSQAESFDPMTEEKKTKKRIILVTRKGDKAAARGGGVMRISKDKYDPKIHNLAVEE